MNRMGSPKGKTHRRYSQEEKVRIVERYYQEHISIAALSRSEGINYSIVDRWITEHAKDGDASLAAHDNRKGNHYSAIHTSSTIDEIGRLQLQVAKLEADVARLKKGYLVKGDGSQKEYVTGNGKTFRLSMSSKKNTP